MANQIHDDNLMAFFRWKHGHHMFHIFLMAMNSTFDDISSLIRANNHECIVDRIYDLVALYDAATATMRYAASFPEEVYECFVRPSMSPPYLSPGFSGVLNKEHKAMLIGLEALAEELSAKFGKDSSQWPSEIGAAWWALKKAKSRNRKHHGLICQKFVKDGVSLLRDFYFVQNKEKKY